MANPNLVNATSILGKTETLALTTSNQTLLNNPASSGKLLKVNTIIIANIDGVTTRSVTLRYYSEDDLGGTGTGITHTINVPNDSSLVVLDKNSCIYLEEDRSLGALASANGDLVAVISYEEIS